MIRNTIFIVIVLLSVLFTAIRIQTKPYMDTPSTELDNIRLQIIELQEQAVLTNKRLNQLEDTVGLGKGGLKEGLQWKHSK